ncbi:ABC transporter permease [Streptomyces cheonanensis]|uniref:ABC transporter permease n=1 Tax=Streptomyces cheonanensis TaxID=312720 RepID=A0ABN2V763_9ACTN
MSTPPPTPSPTPQTATARIHNIGYRHYDGPRLGIPYARLSLFTHSLRGAYGLGRSARSKILPFALAAIMAVPALVMVAVAVTVGMNSLPIGYTEYALFMQPIIGLYLALAGPQLVSLDQRYHTLPLYFSRPLEHADYVRAKAAALAAALFVFTAVPVVLLYIGALLAKLSPADETLGFAKGLLFSAVFSVLHAAIALLIASLTPRRGFGVAAIIGALTVPYFAVTSVQFVIAEQGSGSLDSVGWLAMLSPGSLLDGFQGALLGGTTEFPHQYAPSGAMGAGYLAVIAGVTALCYVLLLRRYRKAGL